MTVGPQSPDYYHIKYDGKDYYWNASDKQWYVDNHVAGYQLPYNPQQIASNVTLSSKYTDYKDTMPNIPGIQSKDLSTISPAQNGPVPTNNGPINNRTSNIYKRDNIWYGRDIRPGASLQELTWNNDKNRGEWGYRDLAGKWWRSATQLQVPPGGRVASYTKDVNYRGQVAPNDKGYTPPPAKPAAKPQSSPPPAPKTYTNVSGFIRTKRTYVGGSSKPIKEYPKEIKSLPKSYDVLFNSLEYQAIDDALIEKMELSIIHAGGDLLTDFNYESIDYLPDYEIQVKDQSDNYLPIDFSLSNFDDMNTNKEEDQVSHKAEILSSLKADLQNIFGSNKFIRKSKYFGKISNDTKKTITKFVPGVSSGNTIDFKYNLLEKYQNYEINIEFDEI